MKVKRETLEKIVREELMRKLGQMFEAPDFSKALAGDDDEDDKPLKNALDDLTGGAESDPLLADLTGKEDKEGKGGGSKVEDGDDEDEAEKAKKGDADDNSDADELEDWLEKPVIKAISGRQIESIKLLQKSDMAPSLHAKEIVLKLSGLDKPFRIIVAVRDGKPDLSYVFNDVAKEKLD